MQFQSIKPSPSSSSQFHVPIPLHNSTAQLHNRITQQIPLNQSHVSNSCYNSKLNHNQQR
ncbi:hypothetical protein LINPERPRIM_LOCUS127 [Linum perenne]